MEKTFFSNFIYKNDLNDPVIVEIGSINIKGARRASKMFENHKYIYYEASKYNYARLKENISHVGVSDAGINIYRFKYKGVDGVFEGVMANEVPWATTLSENGYYMVDYSKVDVDFRRINQWRTAVVRDQAEEKKASHQ